MIPIIIPVQDTSSHVMSDHSFQQPLENNSSGEILQSLPLSLLVMETNMIASFNCRVP